MPRSYSIILSLGSNLGNRQANIQQALGSLDSLGGQVLLQKISSFYESSPVDYLQQDLFLNLCVEISTSLPPFLLLDLLQKIEGQFQKQKVIAKGPRHLDIDLIFYGPQIIKHPNLQIPHPGYRQRLFVLLPLLEIAPHARDPQTQRPLYFYANKNFPQQWVQKKK